MASSSAKPQIIIKIKRKAAHGGGHHGGAWKVAYADFITCMFALFMVLWLLTQADLQLRQDIARYFRNSSVLPGGSMIGSQTSAAKSEAHILDASITVVRGLARAAARGRARDPEGAEQNPNPTQIRDNVRVRSRRRARDPGRRLGRRRAEGPALDVNSSALSALQHPGRAGDAPRHLPNRIEIGGHTDARPLQPARSRATGTCPSPAPTPPARSWAHGLPRTRSWHRYADTVAEHRTRSPARTAG
jgi:chemotaxis protein MotB